MSSNEELRTRFMEAFSLENIKSFLNVLECMNVQVDKPDAQGRTMLWHCVVRRDYRKVGFLIACGAEPDLTDNEGLTPVHVALMQGESIDELIARILLGSRLSTSISKILQGGLSVDQLFLYHAKHSDNPNGIRLLLNLGANVNTFDESRETALMWATRYGCLQNMKILLAQRSLDLYAKDREGHTALHIAACHDQLEAVDLLLSNEKLDVNCRDRMGRSAFWLSVHLNRDRISERFLNDSRLDVNCRCDSSSPQYMTTPLYVACYRNNIQMVSRILAATSLLRVNPNIQGDMGMSPLGAAAFRGAYELVAMLLNADGIRINAAEEGEDDPFWLAILHRQPVSVMELFLNDKRLDINCQNNRNKDTYLIAATRCGNISLINRLLEFKGIKLSTRNKEGKSAVEIADRLGNQMIIQSMASRGAERFDISPH